MLRYRLDDLGWYQFECMIQALLKAKLGLGIESWAGRADHGRDAFFKGSLEFPTHGKLQEGPFVFQVKFVEEANAAGANPRPRILSAVKSEIKLLKIRRTPKDQKIIYSLLTNVTLSPELREKISKLFKDSFPLFEPVTMGGQDVCDLLDDSPNIRVSFPQILSLRDLDALLNDVVAKPIIERSKSMIEEAKEISLVFYPTNAYSETIRKLQHHNFAVLEGPPEVGKTTIARMIGLSRLSIGWEAHECLNPNEFLQVFSHDRPQIFIADDAFGSTEYDPARTTEWSYNLDRILRRLDHNHWLIWTARKHILEIALQRMRLQGKGENFPEPGSILIDAGALTSTEKSMILYRHAKSAGFDIEARNLLKKYAKIIVYDTYFTPERIRRFIKDSFPSLIDDFKSGKLTPENLNQLIKKIIKEPTKSLTQAFDCLSEGHKRLLISRLDLDTSRFLNKPDDLSRAFERHKPQVSEKSYKQLESDLSLFFLKKPLRHDLFFSNGSWVHPSMRDLVINYLVSNKTSRLDFLSKCSIGGISLALSIGGGSEGTRTFPLVIDEEDQLILKERIKELIFNVNSNELKKLLENIREAKIKSSEIEYKDIVNFINDIFEIVIDEVLLRWKNKEEIIDVQMLNLYFNMVKYSKTFRPSPQLNYTWDKYFSKITKSFTYPEDYVKSHSYTAIDQFLDLVKIISRENPRFLKYVNFPECFTELCCNFIKACIRLSESVDYSISAPGISDYELFSSEAEKYHDLHDIVEKIFNLNIDIEIGLKPEEALDIIYEVASEWEQMAQEESGPEPDYDDYRSSEYEDYVDIEEIFSDL